MRIVGGGSGKSSQSANPDPTGDGLRASRSFFSNCIDAREDWQCQRDWREHWHPSQRRSTQWMLSGSAAMLHAHWQLKWNEQLLSVTTLSMASRR